MWAQFLLGLYSTKMFQEHIRVSRPTFAYLCHKLAHILSKKDTKLRPCIQKEDRISLVLHWLGSSNTLGTLADLYETSKLSASIIVQRLVRGD